MRLAIGHHHQEFPQPFQSTFRVLSEHFQCSPRIYFKLISGSFSTLLLLSWWSSFRAVSEQFQSSFRAVFGSVLDSFQSHFQLFHFRVDGVVSEQFQSRLWCQLSWWRSLRAVSEQSLNQFLTHFRATFNSLTFELIEQSQCSFRAVLDLLYIRLVMEWLTLLLLRYV